MNVLHSIAYYQVFSFLPVTTLVDVSRINTKSKKLVENITAGVCDEQSVNHLSQFSSICSLTLTGTTGNFHPSTADILHNFSNIQKLDITPALTQNQLRTIVPSTVTFLSVNFHEGNDAQNASFITEISKQTQLQSLSISKYYSRYNSFSSAVQVVYLTALSKLTSLKVFCYNHQFTKLTSLASFNVFVADSNYFNDTVSFFTACRRLRSLTLRNYFTHFSMIEQITTLTHLTSIDLTEKHPPPTASLLSLPPGLRLKALTICNGFAGDVSSLSNIFPHGVDDIRLLCSHVDFSSVRTLANGVVKLIVLKDVTTYQHLEVLPSFCALTGLDIINSTLPSPFFCLTNLKHLMLAFIPHLDCNSVSTLSSLTSIVLSNIQDVINASVIPTLPSLTTLTITRVDIKKSIFFQLRPGLKLRIQKDYFTPNDLVLLGSLKIIVDFSKEIEDDSSLESEDSSFSE
ncbi:Uncharacterized protein QTN25_003375 [Entamoeba marina]